MDKQTQKELLAMVKNNYEEIADDFCETRKKRLWPELYALAEQVKEEMRVFDVGCGNGRLLQAFRGRKIDYLGLDSSQALIEKARENNPGHKFITGDILNLGEVPEYGFDYVFCAAVLHHIPGRNLRISALKQLKNKINKNGRIIITVWNLWSHKKFKKLAVKYFLLKLIKKNKMDFGDIIFDWKNSQREALSQRYYHAFRKGELKKIFKKAGLKTERIYKDEYNYYAVLKKP